jgi:hypothetical protein
MPEPQRTGGAKHQSNEQAANRCAAEALEKKGSFRDAFVGPAVSLFLQVWNIGLGMLSIVKVETRIPR